MDVKVQNIHTLLAWTLLMYLCCQVCCQQCSQPCQCPSTVPTCPNNIPLIHDGCGCCQICARQKSESCTETLVCDKQRALECDYSASYPGGPGECVSQEELGCELNGVFYKDGEVFQPSCSTHCKCKGGGVTCVPLCPENVRRPSPDCPNPQRVHLPGKCCKEWICEDMDNSVSQGAHTASSHNQLLPGLPSNPSHPSFNCINHSTEWSACSRTCGHGISTRVSNHNPACRLEQQIRLCTIRPCQTFPHQTPVWPRRCKSSYRSPVPTHLVSWGCYSTQLYRPRYCGLCTDGRCCTPYLTHTVTVPFSCPGGHLIHQSIMMISSCICHNNCSYSSSGTSMMSAFRG